MFNGKSDATAAKSLERKSNICYDRCGFNCERFGFSLERFGVRQLRVKLRQVHGSRLDRFGVKVRQVRVYKNRKYI